MMSTENANSSREIKLDGVWRELLASPSAATGEQTIGEFLLSGAGLQSAEAAALRAWREALAHLATLGAAGITVTHAGGIAAASISEFVFARVLQHAKHLRTLEAQQAARTWEVQFGTEIAGRSIGIVGLGSIGRGIARRARAS